ncbi:hypothetical protein FRX31_008009 [Thalictrum thalictroides]|uniref:Uncharacterized protein n=1 Tax=Thalictrum thalictroides TaxID=46969 RepID=A0A7J6WYA6_THATH|nr:hypothetical protein FRX31_008009 [Thalictrum thalictroides]
MYKPYCFQRLKPRFANRHQLYTAIFLLQPRAALTRVLGRPGGSKVDQSDNPASMSYVYVTII